MSVKLKTQDGEIDLSMETIGTVVGSAVTDNYGVVGMASRHQIRDNVQDILKRENYGKGIIIQQIDEEIIVDVHIIVNYGTRISEICRNIQERVKYDLHALLGIEASVVNVFVQGVRVIED